MKSPPAQHHATGRDVPKFHEVKLFYGGQELRDGTPIALELQAVVTVSPAEIFAKDFFGRAHAVAGLHQSTRCEGQH